MTYGHTFPHFDFVVMFIYKTAFDLIEPEHDLMRLLLHSQANRAGLGETKCE